MAKAKASVAVPPALPAAPAATPSSAPVALHLSNAKVAVDVGTVCTAHGVTFRSPVDGLLCTGDKRNPGWVLIPHGTSWCVVPGTIVNPDGSSRPGMVCVANLSKDSSVASRGHHEGVYKAWPFDSLVVLPEGGAL